MGNCFDKRAMPEVSVIINIYNGEKYLRQAIDSVYGQTYKDWEIVVWDDASTDNSAALAKSYDKRVKYFLGNKARSLGDARNRAIDQASGQYLAFLDQDDFWLPSKLEKQVPLFKKNPSVGLVFSDAIDLNETTGEEITHFRHLGVSPPRGQIFRYLLRMDSYPISMPTAVIRAEALRTLGERFSTEYTFAEEYDLFLRMAYKWEVDYVNEPLAVYRIHSTNFTLLHHQRIPEELALIMGRLRAGIPEVETTCGREISVNERVIALQLGKSLWQQQRGREARRALQGHLNHYKTIGAYVGSFLPFGCAARLRAVGNRLFRSGEGGGRKTR